MSYSIAIKQEAYDDLQAAYDYYEEEQQGLGDKFIEKVRDRIAYIQKFPLHFNKVERAYRQALLNKFPYLIIYELEGKEIVVYAVFHCSKSPVKKFRQ